MAQILPHHMLSNLRSRLLKVCVCLGAVGGENPQACWQGRPIDELFAFPLLSNHLGSCKGSFVLHLQEYCSRQDLVHGTCGLIGKAPDSDLGIAGSNPAMRSDQGLVAQLLKTELLSLWLNKPWRQILFSFHYITLISMLNLLLDLARGLMLRHQISIWGLQVRVLSCKTDQLANVINFDFRKSL